MKSVLYFSFIAGALLMTGCDNANEKAKEKTVLLKDAPADIREPFINSFKKSCIEEAIKQPNVTQEMHSRLQKACECAAEKAENLITMEQLVQLASGDSKTQNAVITELKGYMWGCLK